MRAELANELEQFRSLMRLRNGSQPRRPRDLQFERASNARIIRSDAASDAAAPTMTLPAPRDLLNAAIIKLSTKLRNATERGVRALAPVARRGAAAPALEGMTTQANK